jgi:DNA-binding MarR family transcriptional regulator
MRHVSNHVSGAFARSLQARRVSVAEWVALCVIQEQKDLSPGELAEAIGMTRGAVSKVLDKLEGKRWIKRATKPDDNRVQLLSLTRLGSRILPELADLADGNDEHFFSCLSAAEQANLRQLLRKLAEFHQLDDMPVD